MISLRFLAFYAFSRPSSPFVVAVVSANHDR